MHNTLRPKEEDRLRICQSSRGLGVEESKHDGDFHHALLNNHDQGPKFKPRRSIIQRPPSSPFCHHSKHLHYLYSPFFWSSPSSPFNNHLDHNDHHDHHHHLVLDHHHHHQAFLGEDRISRLTDFESLSEKYGEKVLPITYTNNKYAEGPNNKNKI